MAKKPKIPIRNAAGPTNAQPATWSPSRRRRAPRRLAAGAAAAVATAALRGECAIGFLGGLVERALRVLLSEQRCDDRLAEAAGQVRVLGDRRAGLDGVLQVLNEDAVARIALVDLREA